MANTKRRAILIVLDSVGIGAMPDAAEYGDEGAHTLGNIFKARGSLHLPNLYRLGLANIQDSRLLEQTQPPLGCYGRAAERTKAKDTICGHWELAGLPLDVPFRTFPNGFPKEFISAFEEKIGRKTLGNIPVSGTTVIAELGEEHVKTGKPIVYTSADSVFQIAAHEAVIPLDELYHICEIAREMLTGDLLVGRVIARPFAGEAGAYMRTVNRKDFAWPPEQGTILDALQEKGCTNFGIGKIEDIFCSRGIARSNHTHTNKEAGEAVLDCLNDENWDFLFANFVDFDMLFGHRNDVEGYARALEAFDALLFDILACLKEQDLLIITADHGCDPTMPGTDHSREYIPVLATGRHCKQDVALGTRDTFADIGATIYEYLSVETWRTGKSFLHQIF
ncbi:phosphopentomutase [Christensenellaceae bacterium OttesenSCG-928-L17]|nr:phosphopentomutase [Christensenellaceae bacterium OttesenSCG-928-L17]